MLACPATHVRLLGRYQHFNFTLIALHSWEGRYDGPGSFQFAISSSDKVLAFTDHSSLLFSNDGTASETVILDSPVLDATYIGSSVYVLQDNNIKLF